MEPFQTIQPLALLVAESELVRRDMLHNIMTGQLNGCDDDCGLFVHWSVYHAGKTTNSRVVAKKIHDSGRPVKIVKARSISLPRDTASAELWFRRVVGFTNEGDDDLSIAQCFEKYAKPRPHHVTIIIDEADAVMSFAGWDELFRLLAHVAIEVRFRLQVRSALCAPS
jgi:hypothetical protein